MLFFRRLSSHNGVSKRMYHYKKGTAKDLMNQSCYHGVNFTIPQDTTVYDAIKRMAGINLGCLAVSSSDSKNFVGVVSERDYLKKVELLGLSAKSVQVSDIMTHRPRVVVAHEDEAPAELMAKMLGRVGTINPIEKLDSE